MSEVPDRPEGGCDDAKRELNDEDHHYELVRLVVYRGFFIPRVA